MQNLASLLIKNLVVDLHDFSDHFRIGIFGDSYPGLWYLMEPDIR